MHRRGELLLHIGRLADAQKREARNLLVRGVLDIDVSLDAAGPWLSFCYFATDGVCAANVEASILPLVAEGKRLAVGAVRAIAVDPAWRGRGLFRTLMTEALGWCDERSDGTTLLYTEDPSLYRSFGFVPVPQHAFIGPPPAPEASALARPLTPGAAKNAAVIREAIGRRAPLSSHCTLLVDAPLFAANLAGDADLRIAHTTERDALIIYETDGDLLILVDVVAGVIPELASVIGALGRTPGRVKTLFAPDQLGWNGEPVAEDTGLMLRGRMPRAMAAPFMFPPTCEF